MISSPVSSNRDRLHGDLGLGNAGRPKTMALRRILVKAAADGKRFHSTAIWRFSRGWSTGAPGPWPSVPTPHCTAPKPRFGCGTPLPCTDRASEALEFKAPRHHVFRTGKVIGQSAATGPWSSASSSMPSSPTGFDEKYPDGMKVNPPKRILQANYLAASLVASKQTWKNTLASFQTYLA